MLLGHVLVSVLLCTFARGMATTESSTSMAPITSGHDESSGVTPVDIISTANGHDESSGTTPLDIIFTTSGHDESTSPVPVTVLSTPSGHDETSSAVTVDSSTSTIEPERSITKPSQIDDTTSEPEMSTLSTTSGHGESYYTTTENPELDSTSPTMTDHTAITPASTNTIPTNSTPTIQPTVFTSMPPSAAPIIVCPSSPCPAQSICLHDTCQCLAGSYLLDGVCTQGQVFPGELHIQSLEFENEMSDRSSEKFRITAAQISDTLSAVFKDQKGYVRTDVLQLQPGSVIATVNNVFEESSTNETSVNRAIKNAIDEARNDTLLAAATFEDTDLCDQEPPPCDQITTTCAAKDGQVICTCIEGYFSNQLISKRICRACPSGQQLMDDKCELCPFGYNGLNCNDSALLAVVVIACTLGGILLLLFLALLLYCCIQRCVDDEKTVDNSPYSVDEFNRPWPVQGITPIPRATTNPNWEPSPSIEMREGGSTNALVDKKNNSNGLSGSYDLNPEGMKTFKGKNPSRYSYLVQGHENPYFLGEEQKD